MDVAALSSAGVSSSQQGTRQQLSVQALKSEAEAQNQLAGMLADAAKAQPGLRTSGSIGTNVNTTA